MQRAVLLGSALALSFGFAAVAQPAAQTPPTTPKPSAAAPPTPSAAAPAPSADAPAAPAPASAPLKEGMAVKDSAGLPIGAIAQIGKTADGQAAAVIDVDGKKVGVLASSLTVAPSGTEAVSAATKAQLLAAAAAPPAQKPG